MPETSDWEPVASTSDWEPVASSGDWEAVPANSTTTSPTPDISTNVGLPSPVEAMRQDPRAYQKPPSILETAFGAVGEAAAAALNIPQAMVRSATGITPKQFTVQTDAAGKEQLNQEDVPLHFQAGKPAIEFRRTEMQPEGNAIGRLIEGFLTPENIALFPFAASRIVQAAFLAQTAPAAVEAATKLVSSETPPDLRRDAATNLLINGLMTYGIASHLAPETTKAVTETIKDTNASEIPSPEGLPKLEVRPQVGESPPLRQPGETAQESLTPETQKAVDETPSVASQEAKGSEPSPAQTLETPGGPSPETGVTAPKPSEFTPEQQARQAEANRKMQEEFGAEVAAAPDLREPGPEAKPIESPADLQKQLQDELYGKSDWASATESLEPLPPESGPIGKAPEFPKIEPQELGAGVSIPKFDVRKMTPLDVATARHSAKLQRSESNARRAVKEIRNLAKSEDRQAAIAIWVEAGGDAPTLTGWATAARGEKFKKAAIAAQSLTPEEMALGRKVRTAFDALYAKGVANDVVTNFRDNYITHIWERPKKTGGLGGGTLKQNFKFNKARTFNTFFEGDQAGFVPKTLSLERIVPAYIKEMDSVIAARQFVKDMAGQLGSDGRPLVIPRGTAKAVTGASGSATLVFPKAIKNIRDAAGDKIDQSDYKTMENQPALQKWSWVAQDEAGNPVMLQSDLSLHPEAYKRIHAMMGTSFLKEWYRQPSTGTAQIPKVVIKVLDEAQSEMKKSMFGLLAPFHQVQEGWHGIGHTVNPLFSIPKIDLRKPDQLDAAAHGLMLLPDKASASSYIEGSGSQSSLLVRGLKKVPVLKALGEVSDLYQDYLFHQYIPGLKFKTYEHILDRNTKRFQTELASGEAPLKDIKLLSAEQANAAYGHLNYALLDRNPSIQHMLRLSLLAPDFLEARARFTGQAVKGLNGKVGQEQLRAIAFLAAAQAGMALAISQLLGTPYDPKHPFEVVYNGRRYAMRSVPEDIFSLVKDTRAFAYSRMNPLIAKGVIQYTYGLNYRGEKVTPLETTTELIAGYIPITARSIPGLRDMTFTGRNQPVSPIEQLAGSLGLRISRYSPISETYKLAHDWEEKNNIPVDRGSYPISKYQQLRYALEDNDTDGAVSAYQELLKTMSAEKIASGFKESITHPFTGSLANDRKFSQSLTDYDKELYDLAVRRRKDIVNRFRLMPKTAPVK